MELFSYPVILALAIGVVLTNIITNAMPKIVALILNIVNIILHISLIMACFIKNVPFAEVTLIVMASVFFYALSYMIFDTVRRRRGGMRDDV